MKVLQYSFLVLFVVCFSSRAFAQKEYSKVYEDFGIWTDLTLKKDISKKWKSSLDYSLRLDENASELRSTFVEINFQRDLKRKWDVGTSIRYTIRTSSQTLRYSIYVKKYIRIKPINVQYRFKTDFNYDLFSDSQDPIKEVFRNKVGIEYSRKKHRLGAMLSAEWFHPLDRDLFLPSDIRFKTGLSYKVNKRIDLKLSYIVQEELNKSKPERDYVCNFGIQYEIKKKKKSKKKSKSK